MRRKRLEVRVPNHGVMDEEETCMMVEIDVKIMVFFFWFVKE